MKKAIIYLTILLGTSSCVHQHFSNSGTTITEYRDVPYYNSIYSEGAIDLFITHDSTYSIKIVAGKNLMDYIETDVVNDQLIIRQAESNIVNVKPIKIYLNADSLNAIELYGSGNFNADELNSSNLAIYAEGSGNLDFQVNSETLTTTTKGSGNTEIVGNVNSHTYSIEGSGNLFARHLYTNSSSVTIEGSGNATVNVADNLDVNIDGSGNVYYYGYPSNINYQIDGSGQLINKN